MTTQQNMPPQNLPPGQYYYSPPIARATSGHTFLLWIVAGLSAGNAFMLVYILSAVAELQQYVEALNSVFDW